MPRGTKILTLLPCDREAVLHQKTALSGQFLYYQMAEGQRFELWVPCGTAVFKTAAINHSAIPPDVW
jgi:hypothetical protein